MFVKFLQLEIKSFFRSASFGANLGMKILTGFAIVYFLMLMLFASIGGYELVTEKLHKDPLKFLSGILIYAWVADLILRFLWQQLSTQNIKPFLTMNIGKNKIVQYTLAKTLTSFLSWGWMFFYIPFSIRLLLDGYSVIGVIGFNLAILSFYLLNNFLNILLNGADKWVYGIAVVYIIFIGLDYYKIFSLMEISEKIFYAFYQFPWLFVLPLIAMFGILVLAYKMILKTFYLDEGLELKKEVGRTQNIAFLDKYGAIGTFINNDIRLLRRSKAAKGVLVMALLFLFYGLLIYSGNIYKSPTMMIFLGIFVTGGFQFMFGQKIPSFDSSYFPLMMTLNVPYKEYLNAKWWLMNMVTFISMIIASFYIYFGWQLYLSILAGAIYNIGVNSQMVLLGGAFNKMPVDLNSKMKSFGTKNNFNIKTMLLLIPQMLIPMAVFGIVEHFFGIGFAIFAIAILGITGFLLKDKIFGYIVKLYKKEKYSTLIAFKQTN